MAQPSSAAVASGLTLRELRDRPLTDLRSVGPKVAPRLAEMGLTTVLDLLELYPRRYHDRTKIQDIAQLEVGEEATATGEVKKVSVRRPPGRRPIVEIQLFDGTSYLRLMFFNQEYRARLAEGTEISVFGKVDLFRGRRQMVNPAIDVIGQAGEQTTGVLLPVYPQSGKANVFSWELRKLVAELLQRCSSRGFADPLDDDLRRQLGLVGRDLAYTGVHRPEAIEHAYAARARLTFDEFLRMQVGLVARKRALARDLQGIAHRVDGPLVARFHDGLPFSLTPDQRRVIDEIAADLAAPGPMHRLLQGEVGSGKTVVAVSALLVAVQGGMQGAFMAPTEVLAEQHALTLRSMLDGLSVAEPGSLLGERPVRVELLTNRTSAADRRRITEDLAAGTVDVLVGTHALIYEGVDFARLGLAVIDEQHRFGVEQRDLLRAKGSEPRGSEPRGSEQEGCGPRAIPDVLVMTATPIPRTAAMLIYGDLDRSELRALPVGRSPITTELIGPGALERTVVYDRIRAEVAAGRQAFVVCPLVDGSDKLEAKAARSSPACGSVCCTARCRRSRRRRSWLASATASSTCWWRRRSSRWGSTWRTPR
jgi:ATP-dependent DNA helicase RecG